MKTTFLTIIIMLTIAGCSFSQNQTAAMQILDATAAKMQNYSSLKIDFNMAIENLQTAKRETYTGNAAFRKDGRYKLDIMGQIIFSDGKTNWTYLKDAEEVNITDNSQDEALMANPQSLFKDYKNNYKIKFLGDKFEKNRPLVEFDLIPKIIEDKKYARITVKIDKAKKQLYSAHYVGKDGVNYLIEISHFVENPTIPDSEIVFASTMFPDAEIIDMR